MAVTVASVELKPRERVGREYHTRYRLTLTGTYETNGVAVSAANLGLSVINDAIPSMARNGTNAFVTRWDQTNKKILLYEGGATANDNPFDEFDNGGTATNYVIDVTGVGF